MADNRSDPTDEIPEADRLEQRATASRPEEGDAAEDVDAMAGSMETDADPADRQEQLTEVGEDDEDYPHA